ncbi:DnaD domain protein [Aquibacillus halophilus]|uniref:DnaD domain protein n=1 Tax=Aquibacillus halophilus TaxID=930132 RepID=A0A6A8DQ19_9BACI|nr:DnaD domain protein [Aquibacillus halophilus]MRH43332.1 DnaD domain protein [Aquibacillus halophilus]
MNYIKEINALYNHLEFNPLSNSAVLLWHALMQVNNKTGWKKEFTVAAMVLCVKAQLKDSTFKRAREELKEKGYIHFQSRGGNQAAIYQMISLTTFEDHSITCNSDSNMIDLTDEPKDNDISDQKADYNLDHKYDHTPVPLIKQNNVKIKPNKNTIINTTNSVISFYQENFKDTNAYLEKEITNWVVRLGDVLVIEAMKRSLIQNNVCWGYVNGILKKWSEKGFVTLEQVEASEEAFYAQKKQAYYKTPQTGKQEIIPDWFHNRNKHTEHLSSNLSIQAGESDVVKQLTDYLERKKQVKAEVM